MRNKRIFKSMLAREKKEERARVARRKLTPMTQVVVPGRGMDPLAFVDFTAPVIRVRKGGVFLF